MQNLQMSNHIQDHRLIVLYILHVRPGDEILGFDLSHGGHLTHGSPVNFSGKLYEPFFYGISKKTGLLIMVRSRI